MIFSLRHCTLIVVLIISNKVIGQGVATHSAIIPEKDFYYLESWGLEGTIKTITIKTYNHRDAARRFLVFDECRKETEEKQHYSLKEETFIFDRKGRLMKRESDGPQGKQATLYGYNFFGKISEIEGKDRLTVFRYDLEGRLLGYERSMGAKVDIVCNVEYRNDSILTVTTTLANNSSDSLTEVCDSLGRIIYSSIKLPSHALKENYFVYDNSGRVVKNWNNLDMHFEYQYDDKNRVVNTYIGKDKSFLRQSNYDDMSGICRITRCELLEGEYIPRNHECLCTAIDGHNNPVQQQIIDCSQSEDKEFFGLKGFVEIIYTYYR